jgi:predicted SAM-dependent methyltransferase
MRYSRLARFPLWTVNKYCERTGRGWHPPAASGLALNIGTGGHDLVGWVNLDETKPGDVLARVPPAPFRDECFDEILMSHVVEHMRLNDGRALMKECHRILKPGGVMTVIVPDGKIISLAYLAGQVDNWKLNDWLLYSYCQESQHRWLYDRRTLTQIVAEAGFVGLRRLNRFTSDRMMAPAWFQVGLAAVKPGTSKTANSFG